MERAVERNGDEAPPFLEAHVHERRFLAHGGIEHQDVHLAEALHHAVHHCIDRLGVHDIGHEYVGLAAGGANLLRDLLGVVAGGARVDRDRRAARRELERNRAPDVAPRSRDKRYFACKIRSLAPPPFEIPVKNRYGSGRERDEG